MFLALDSSRTRPNHRHGASQADPAQLMLLQSCLRLELTTPRPEEGGKDDPPQDDQTDAY